MRSTKDLKEIVTGSRAKSKMNGIAGKDYSAYADGEQTTTGDEEDGMNDRRVQKKLSGNGDTWKNKFKGNPNETSDNSGGSDYRSIAEKYKREYEAL